MIPNEAAISGNEKMESSFIKFIIMYRTVPYRTVPVKSVTVRVCDCVSCCPFQLTRSYSASRPVTFLPNKNERKSTITTTRRNLGVSSSLSLSLSPQTADLPSPHLPSPLGRVITIPELPHFSNVITNVMSVRALSRPLMLLPIFSQSKVRPPSLPSSSSTSNSRGR